MPANMMKPVCKRVHHGTEPKSRTAAIPAPLSACRHCGHERNGRRPMDGGMASNPSSSSARTPPIFPRLLPGDTLEIKGSRHHPTPSSIAANHVRICLHDQPKQMRTDIDGRDVSFIAPCNPFHGSRRRRFIPNPSKSSYSCHSRRQKAVARLFCSSMTDTTGMPPKPAIDPAYDERPERAEPECSLRAYPAITTGCEQCPHRHRGIIGSPRNPVHPSPACFQVTHPEILVFQRFSGP